MNTPPDTQKSIMLVDDDESLTKLWSTFLRKSGYHVCVIDKVNEAMNTLAHESFDLLISDIYFRRNGTIDKEGGVTLVNRVRLERFKAKDGQSALPILVVSGQSATRGMFQFDALATVSGLVNATLQKPIRLEVLLDTVKTLIKDHQ